VEVEEVKIYNRTDLGIFKVSPYDEFYLAALDHMLRGFFEAKPILSLELEDPFETLKEDDQRNSTYKMMSNFYNYIQDPNGSRGIYDAENGRIINVTLLNSMLDKMLANKATNEEIEALIQVSRSILFLKYAEAHPSGLYAESYLDFFTDNPEFKAYNERLYAAISKTAALEDKRKTHHK